MKKRHKPFFFCWLPLFIYCLLIFIQSSFPAAVEEPSLPHADKLGHFLVYGLLAILFFRAFRTTFLRNNEDCLMLLSMLASVLYGVSDEIHQYFVPSRNADMADVLADTMGSMCGVFFYWLSEKHIDCNGFWRG